MSGHSKWSTIKHKKGAQDQKRGVLFTRLSREILVAAKSGDPDPDLNFRLRLAIDNAKMNNMPKDNIERCIARATKSADASDLHEATYEAYAPGGAGIIVQVLTDNKNRAASAVRTKITRGGGSMTANGSVSWNFTSKGRITVETKEKDPEEAALEIVETGADDVDIDGNTVEAFTAYDQLASVRNQIEKIPGVEITRSELTMEPNTLTPLDEKDARSTLRLLDELEDLEDVQKVFSNADFPEAALQEYAA